MALERTGAIGLVALLAGCGDGGSGSPTGPTGMAGLALEPGSYVVVATAQSTIPPITAGCIGTGTFVGVSILSFVTLSREADAWVARSTTPADGDAEIRITQVGMNFSQPAVSGVARGTLIDRRAVEGMGIASVRFSGAGNAGATLTGSYYSSPTAQLAGSASGLVAVSSSIGSGSCERGEWAIRKPEPCEASRSCS